MARIVLHLKPADATPDLKGWHLRLYRELAALCTADGVPLDIRARDRDIRVGTRTLRDDRFDDGNLHIIDDRSLRATGVLNAGVAYFWEFWHLDPAGTKAFSSIGQEIYDPAAVSDQRAENFIRNLRRKYSDKRKSKYRQPSERQALPANAISVFFQGRHPVSSGATAHGDLDILRAVLDAAGDRPVIVKPHPFSSTEADIDAVRSLALTDPRLALTQANVHDILPASLCTVSVNSTVALEGYLHGVPAILCGTCDFHHLACPATDLAQMPAALDAALSQEADYDRYLAWYFVKHCIHIRSGRLHETLWHRFAAAGFPRDRFR
ncbi:MAG: hypothetical protein ACE369_11780 [Roseovarius sp.]